MLWENMREDDSNWFSRWEEDLPSPEELMPLSQTLITPDLALAFDIQNHSNNSNNSPRAPSIPFPQSSPNTAAAIARSSQIAATQHPNSSEFDTNSAELGSPATTGDEPARTLKRPRLVWTPQLHKRFVDAVAHLGIKNAVPKTIMQLMSVDGLTRENVASHLQKYRLYLKRMQGLSSGGGMGAAAADPATDHLFASSPVPPHFLHQGRSNSEHFLPFLPVPALHHQQPVAASAVAHPQIHQQYHHYKPAGPFGSPPNGHFDHAFMSMSSQPVHRMGAPLHNSVPPSYIEDMESGTANGGRRILTLFPTGDD